VVLLRSAGATRLVNQVAIVVVLRSAGAPRLVNQVHFAVVSVQQQAALLRPRSGTHADDTWVHVYVCEAGAAVLTAARETRTTHNNITRMDAANMRHTHESLRNTWEHKDCRQYAAAGGGSAVGRAFQHDTQALRRNSPRSSRRNGLPRTILVPRFTYWTS